MTNVTSLSFDRGSQSEGRRLHLREIVPDVDAPLETVGLDLRAARQRKGEDLASVSCSLKIQKDHLNALEESQFDLLPGRAYAVGFVRSYARYLGLDAAELVERYKAEIAGFDEGDEKEVCVTPDIERKYPQGTIAFVALLLIAIAYGGYYLQASANQMLSERETGIPERLEAVVAEPPVVEPTGRIASVAPAVERPPVGRLPASVEPRRAESETAASVSAELPVGQIYGTRNLNSRLSLRIHEATRVRVVGADDTLFINRNLGPGDIYQTPNVEGMTISTANSGAVELVLDGTSLGFLDSGGGAADALSLNPQDIVERARQAAD